MRRCAIFKSIQEPAEFLLDFLIFVTEKSEDAPLQFGVMDTDTAAGKFKPVTDYIVTMGPYLSRFLFQNRLIFFPRFYKRMMFRFPFLVIFIPGEQGEIKNKGESQQIRVSQAQPNSHFFTQFAQGFIYYLRFTGHNQ